MPTKVMLARYLMLCAAHQCTDMQNVLLTCSNSSPALPWCGNILVGLQAKLPDDCPTYLIDDIVSGKEITPGAGTIRKE